MKRQDVLDLYDVNEHGIITSPGKFEGEMLYIPYFWCQDADECEIDPNGDWYTFQVTDTDRIEFPELADVTVVFLHETNQGFVISDTTA